MTAHHLDLRRTRPVGVDTELLRAVYLVTPDLTLAQTEPDQVRWISRLAMAGELTATAEIGVRCEPGRPTVVAPWELCAWDTLDRTDLEVELRARHLGDVLLDGRRDLEAGARWVDELRRPPEATLEVTEVCTDGHASIRIWVCLRDGWWSARPYIGGPPRISWRPTTPGHIAGSLLRGLSWLDPVGPADREGVAA